MTPVEEWSEKMPSPFPGMDPYLENAEIFPDLHDSMVTYLREAIQANFPAPYFAALGRRVWIEVSRRSVGPNVQVRHTTGGAAAPPRTSTGRMVVASAPLAGPIAVKIAHDEIREPFVEIFVPGDEGKRLVTSIEVLSLSNKTHGEYGRDLYPRKQKEVLSSMVHLVEIDFLRAGQHTTAVPLEAARSECGAFDYHVSVRRFDVPETFFVYPVQLGDHLPPIEIPLLPGDAPITIDLQAIFDRCYDAGPYRREIRYGVDPIIPALREDKAEWSSRVLCAAHGGAAPETNA
jgi:hypothetical protein